MAQRCGNCGKAITWSNISTSILSGDLCKHCLSSMTAFDRIQYSNLREKERKEEEKQSRKKETSYTKNREYNKPYIPDVCQDDYHSFKEIKIGKTYTFDGIDYVAHDRSGAGCHYCDLRPDKNFCQVRKICCASACYMKKENYTSNIETTANKNEELITDEWLQEQFDYSEKSKKMKYKIFNFFVKLLLFSFFVYLLHVCGYF